jgi:hypothetical protein
VLDFHENKLLLDYLKRIAVAEERIATAFEKLVAEDFPTVAVAAQFLIEGKQPMSTTAFPLQDTQEVPYSVVGTDADGDPTSLIPDGASLQLTSSDPTIVAVVPDNPVAAGMIGSGNLVGQPKLGQVVIDGNVVDANGNVLFKPAGLPMNVINNASVATGASFSLGTPVSQPSAAAPAQPPAGGAVASAAARKSSALR